MVRGKGSMRDKKKVSEHPNYTPNNTKKVMVDPTTYNYINRLNSVIFQNSRNSPKMANRNLKIENLKIQWIQPKSIGGNNYVVLATF